jgi:hypothetical protein
MSKLNSKQSSVIDLCREPLLENRFINTFSQVMAGVLYEERTNGPSRIRFRSRQFARHQLVLKCLLI